MRVAILYDAGSDDWSPQDVAAVVGNVHEVRDVLRRRGHEVELLPVRLGDFRWITRVRRRRLIRSTRSSPATTSPCNCGSG